MFPVWQSIVTAKTSRWAGRNFVQVLELGWGRGLAPGQIGVHGRLGLGDGPGTVE